MLRNFIVNKIVQESTTIKSFYLINAKGESIEDYLPGQFITVEVPINGKSAFRNYTVSDAPKKGYFRLTIKREKNGAVSKYLHDHIKEGDLLNISKPSGKFHIEPSVTNPIVLISGGVGITPMLSMAEYVVAHQSNRSIYFVHSSINKQVQPMKERLKEMQRKYANLKLSIFHTKPEGEVKGIDYDEEGYITKKHLYALKIEANATYYLCGPTLFMESMYEHLKELQIDEKKIDYEFFSEGKKLGVSPVFTDTMNTEIKVNFAKSGIIVNWPKESASILDLAEANGLSPAFSCRMGTCSTCETRLTNGEITYDPEPFMEATEGTIFICCAKPIANITLDL